MMARTHVVFGLALCLAAGRLGVVPVDALTLGAAGIGSLLPDLDHPKSTFGRKVPFVSVPFAAIAGHRGFTHSLIGVGLCVAGLLSVVGGLAAPPWAGALEAGILGYLSHLLIDMGNPAGVPLLFPSRRRFRFPLTCRPGGLLESLLFGLLSAVVVVGIGSVLAA